MPGSSAASPAATPPDEAGEPVAFPTTCGLALHGRLFRPASGESPEVAVVLLGALAAPARYLSDTAAFLAGEGYSALTFDYRGVGRSLHSGDPRTNLDDWALDVRAAIRAARATLRPRRLLVVGHSIGGMLLGHAGVREVDGALLIGASQGLPRLYRGRGRLRIEAAYRVLPRLASAFGELPGWRLLLGEPLPRDVVLHWVRWGREGRFARWDGTPSARRFAAYQGPLIGVHVTDDDYAPLPTVDALLRWFSAAGVRREVFDPTAHGPERVGHFGLLRAGAPEWARAKLLGWLKELEEA